MVNLDRFLVSTEWEMRFPLCNAWSLTRVGSDHTPIILDSGEHGASRPIYFFFENKWLLDLDFTTLISQKWQEVKERRPENCYSLNAWHGSLCAIRQFLKGWGIKQAGENKKIRSALLTQLEAIDREAEIRRHLRTNLPSRGNSLEAER